jgi:hypothetical protein
MKNVVFWQIKTHFVLHRRHITSPLQNPAGQFYVRFEVFTAVAMKNAVGSIRATRRHTPEGGTHQATLLLEDIGCSATHETPYKNVIVSMPHSLVGRWTSTVCYG